MKYPAAKVVVHVVQLCDTVKVVTKVVHFFFDGVELFPLLTIYNLQTRELYVSTRNKMMKGMLKGGTRVTTIATSKCKA